MFAIDIPEEVALIEGDSSDIFPSKTVSVIVSKLLVTSITPLPILPLKIESEILLPYSLELNSIDDTVYAEFCSKIVLCISNVA